MIVGSETTYSKYLHEFCLNNDLTNRVTFLTNVNYTDLPIIMQMATLFIYLKNIGIAKHGVIIYFCVIYALEITTLYNLIHGCKILPFLGSTLFVISDSMIGLSALKNKSKQFLPYIMITYIAAQLLLTAGSL